MIVPPKKVEEKEEEIILGMERLPATKKNEAPV
jgi:hypothetical protein